MSALVPVLSWIALNAATGVLLTIPVSRRLYALPIMLIPAAISFSTIQNLYLVAGLPELWGLLTLGGLIHFTSVLFVRKWTLRKARTSANGPLASVSWLSPRAWTRMYKVATNPRLIKIPYEDVIGAPAQSTSIHKKFSPKKLIWLLITIATHRSLNVLVLSHLLGGISIDDFAPPKDVFLRRFLWSEQNSFAKANFFREAIIRMWFVTSTIWMAIIVLDCLHAGTAVMFIYILRTDTPDEWPDLFGSPLEAFTVTRFWSRYWHRIHRSGYTSWADLMLSRLTKHNMVVQRVSMTFLFFLMSGIIHQLTSLQLDPGCTDLGELQFFAMNAAAVCLEYAVRCTFAPRQPCKASKADRVDKAAALAELPTLLPRCLGYLWVIGFFAWASPKCYYQRVHCMIAHKTQNHAL